MMKRTAQIGWVRAATVLFGGGTLVLVLSLMLGGCGKVATTLTGGQAVAFSNASLAEEKARAIDDRAQRRAELDKVYERYLAVVEQNPTGRFANRARYQAAQIQKELTVPGGANYERATTLLQEVVELAPTGYLGGLARSDIAAIRKNREDIRRSRQIFDNTPEDAPTNRRLAAIDSLITVARGYESLRDADSAIDTYRRVVQTATRWSQEPGDEFYRKAAQAQFAIGNIYFYTFYNYTDGWKEYTAVIEKFPESFEAGRARTLLLQTNEALTTIQQDQAYVRSKRKEIASQFVQAGRRVNPNELYGVYTEQVAKTLLTIAQTWEGDPLRNRVAAIKNYRLIMDELWSEMFVAADAAYQIGRLYQDDGQYERAIDAYTEMLDRFPQAFRRDDAVYNRAVCYETIREFETAYREYKAALSLGTNTSFYRAVEQKVRQLETDEDGDGFMLYQELQAGTSDKDPTAYPGSRRTETEVGAAK